MPEQTGHVDSSDGTRLFYRWRPRDEPRSTVVLVHGFAEHSGRYLHVMDAMHQAGHACLAFDYRGHGQANGKRVHVCRFGEYVDDLRCAVDLARARQPSGKLFVVGHSQGGLISLAFALDHGDRLDGLVVSSPAMGFKLHVPAWKDLLGRVMSGLVPALAIPSGIDTALVCRDPEVVRAYEADPLVVSFARARWYTEVQETQRRVREGAGRITLPTLMLQAGADGIIDPEASRRLFGLLGAQDKTWTEYDGFYHEIFNEPDQGRVFGDVQVWLEAHL